MCERNGNDSLGCARRAIEGAKLATQITRLTLLGCSLITRRRLTTLVRVQMRASARAIAIGGDGLLVNMVHYELSALVN